MRINLCSSTWKYADMTKGELRPSHYDTPMCELRPKGTDYISLVIIQTKTAKFDKWSNLWASKSNNDNWKRDLNTKQIYIKTEKRQQK